MGVLEMSSYGTLHFVWLLKLVELEIDEAKAQCHAAFQTFVSPSELKVKIRFRCG